MRVRDRLADLPRSRSAVTLASLSVVVATLAVGGFVVARLSTAPTRMAGVLAALAVLIGALVPILHALGS
jgi:hypothetical protein